MEIARFDSVIRSTGCTNINYISPQAGPQAETSDRVSVQTTTGICHMFEPGARHFSGLTVISVESLPATVPATVQKQGIMMTWPNWKHIGALVACDLVPPIKRPTAPMVKNAASSGTPDSVCAVTFAVPFSLMACMASDPWLESLGRQQDERSKRSAEARRLFRPVGVKGDVPGGHGVRIERCLGGLVM